MRSIQRSKQYLWKSEFKPLLDQMLLGNSLGVSHMVDIFINTLSFLPQFCSGLDGQSPMVSVIVDLEQLGFSIPEDTLQAVQAL